jgi:gamma-glutamylputrescine oxidase
MKLPKDQVYWYTLRKPKPTPLNQDIVVDIAIVGGGMAGLMCAQKLKSGNKNLNIAVIESSFCGGGASGKSSGFITPDSELELSDLVREYGEQEGKRLWDFVRSGVASIKNTIERKNIKCDFSVQDSLFIANDSSGFRKVHKEYEVQSKLGYKPEFYKKESIPEVLGSTNYLGAVRSKDTFGMISYLYCQDLKEALIREGVAIYEETPVEHIVAPYIKTNKHTVEAGKIVVCTDRFLPRFHLAEKEVYHAQTFIAVSKPLSSEIIKKIFTDNLLMVWDTDLIYQYYRIVEGNRLLLGAASVFYTYKKHEIHAAEKVFKKMQKYINKKFPQIAVEFEYMWPGLIGVSKDFLPVMGKDPVMKNVYFTGAGAGLPWAAAMGEYIADKILNGRSDFDERFSPLRAFPVGTIGQFILSKPLSFAVSHGIKKYLR